MNLYRRLKISTAVLLLITAAGCTLDDVSSSNDETITEQDLQAASQILGESLSSDNSGILLSLNDALTNFSSTNFTTSQNKTGTPTTQDDRSGRGGETNYNYSYDQQTGTHTISFSRQVDRPLFSKTVIDTLNYIFKDNNGAFIESPDTEADRIEFINYNANREGEILTPRKSSFFVRTDTFLIDGVSDATPVLSIDGVHNSNGNIEVDNQVENQAFERSYELEINFLSIEIEKPSSGPIDLSRGVTGTLSWEMTIRKSANGSSDSKTLRGTIEMSGDGTALLRFQDLFKRFQVNLRNGDVKDQDEEFEGRVQSVNISEEFITLVNGRSIYLTKNTEIDDDDYTSLEEVQQAVNDGVFVWAEGEGYVNNNRFYAEEIEFEREDEEGDAEGEIEFKEWVSSVDLENKTFTLAQDVVVQITENTTIENEGDYITLQEVADALENGAIVEADGSALEETENPDIDLTAVNVEFDREEQDDDDNDEND
ncbi:DUF5666 domain-containing protein [Fodinibius sp.]|uniref:DUF5666 domain-containing protein n=1 Tax=Fodinibius sp. TaxID=1872440 RepID=UPI002ACE7899|nr:DUF5666 domain-containing protein [Fodinibius sp.]MDZ7657766.1 DUF5666 domain-containing protein [Fodinibius sp.]